MLSLCPFDISVGVGAFVVGLSQISSFLSWKTDEHRDMAKCLTRHTKMFLLHILIALYYAWWSNIPERCSVWTGHDVGLCGWPLLLHCWYLLCPVQSSLGHHPIHSMCMQCSTEIGKNKSRIKVCWFHCDFLQFSFNDKFLNMVKMFHQREV